MTGVQTCALPIFYFILIHIFIDGSVSRSVTADVLMGRSPKPSFLIWEEVYQKLSEVEDARWLCRATDLAVSRLSLPSTNT